MAQMLPLPHPRPLLPNGWLVIALFTLNPLWWALGFGDLSWCFAFLPLAAWILTRHRFTIPPSVGLFALYLAWTLITVVQIDQATRYIAYFFRLTSGITGLCFAIYVYNERRVTREQFARWISWFWVAAIIGGYLGLLLPAGQLRTTLASLILPNSITSNDLVENMVKPGFAQRQDQFGVAVVRPKTLFPFTNEWGGNVGLLTPFFVIGFLQHPNRRRRIAGWVLAAAAIVPIVKSVNRGLWLSLGLFLAVFAIRALLRGRLAMMSAITGVSLLILVIVLMSPLRNSIVDRLSAERSTDARAGIYREAWEGALESPVLGHGGPRPSANPFSPPIGTHGQFWLVIFSHGFVGIGLYIAWSVASIGGALQRRDQFSIIISAVLVIGAMQMFFYNLLPTSLPIMLTALGLCTRPPDTDKLLPSASMSTAFDSDVEVARVVV